MVEADLQFDDLEARTCVSGTCMTLGLASRTPSSRGEGTYIVLHRGLNFCCSSASATLWNATIEQRYTINSKPHSASNSLKMHISSCITLLLGVATVVSQTPDSEHDHANAALTKPKRVAIIGTSIFTIASQDPYLTHNSRCWRWRYLGSTQSPQIRLRCRYSIEHHHLRA
jgi:hypothetical protein